MEPEEKTTKAQFSVLYARPCTACPRTVETTEGRKSGEDTPRAANQETRIPVEAGGKGGKTKELEGRFRLRESGTRGRPAGREGRVQRRG